MIPCIAWDNFESMVENRAPPGSMSSSMSGFTSKAFASQLIHDEWSGSADAATTATMALAFHASRAVILGNEGSDIFSDSFREIRNFDALGDSGLSFSPSSPVSALASCPCS